MPYEPGRRGPWPRESCQRGPWGTRRRGYRTCRRVAPFIILHVRVRDVKLLLGPCQPTAAPSERAGIEGEEALDGRRRKSQCCDRALLGWCGRPFSLRRGTARRPPGSSRRRHTASHQFLRRDDRDGRGRKVRGRRREHGVTRRGPPKKRGGSTKSTRRRGRNQRRAHGCRSRNNAGVVRKSHSWRRKDASDRRKVAKRRLVHGHRGRGAPLRSGRDRGRRDRPRRPQSSVKPRAERSRSRHRAMRSRFTRKISAQQPDGGRGRAKRRALDALIF